MRHQHIVEPFRIMTVLQGAVQNLERYELVFIVSNTLLPALFYAPNPHI